MNSRDAKTKILYSLNYFRSIQKRLMLDLREFGTRERVLGDVTDPLIPAKEADPQIVDTLNIVLSNTNKARQVVEAARNDDQGEDTLSGVRKTEKNMKARKQQTKGNNSHADNDSSQSHTIKSKMADNKSKMD